MLNPAPDLDVLPGFYKLISETPAITTHLETYRGSPSIHTRRPIPDDSTYPLITIGPVVARGDEDGINDYRPIIILDLIVYGDQPEHYRVVEQVGHLLFGLLHRKRNLVEVPNYRVMDTRCTGPIPAPTDDEQTVGRAVTVTMRLAASGS